MVSEEIRNILIEKAYIAWECDRRCVIRHYMGPKGVLDLVRIIVNEAGISDENVSVIYDELMSILDEIALNKTGVTAISYKDKFRMYMSDWEMSHK